MTSSFDRSAAHSRTEELSARFSARLRGSSPPGAWLLGLLLILPDAHAVPPAQGDATTAAGLIGKYAPTLRHVVEVSGPGPLEVRELASLRFQPTERPLVAADLARKLAPDAATGKELSKAFPGLLTAYADLVKQGGQEPHDVAVAYAYFIAVNWSVASGGKDVDDAASEALLAQVRSVLRGSELSRADAESKQRLLETLVILSSFAAGAHARGIEEKDSALAESMRAMAAANLRTALGLAPEDLRLTGRGLSFHASRLSFTVPSGWSSSRHDGVDVLTPGDQAPGSVYALIVSLPRDGEETLKQVLANARKELASGGEFKASGSSKTGTSRGGWQYRWGEGSFERDGKTVQAAVAALARAGQTASLFVIADTGETLHKYATSLGQVIESIGALNDVPSTAGAPPLASDPPQLPAVAAAGPEALDLVYKTPPGWSEQKAEDYTLLVHREQEQPGTDFYGVREYRLIILKSWPFEESPGKTFESLWKAVILPPFETAMKPLPMRRRLKSGLACYLDGEFMKSRANGGQVQGVLYVLHAKDRVVPVIGVYVGNDRKLEGQLSDFFNTATLRNEKADRRPLYSSKEVVGEWSTSSLSLANYVDAGGRYAGDASISTRETYEFRADGTLREDFLGIQGTSRPIRERRIGKWTIEDAHLVLELAATAGEAAATRRLHIHGVGQPPNGAGPALYLPPSYAGENPPDFSFPRRALQANWYGKVTEKDR